MRHRILQETVRRANLWVRISAEFPVALDPKLLEILACPLCKTEVRPTPDGKGLVCGSCRRRYPVVDDIPIMLVEEAIVEEEGRP
jgi:uncharacterized protein YbaR (Trm112 family)